MQFLSVVPELVSLLDASNDLVSQLFQLRSLIGIRLCEHCNFGGHLVPQALVSRDVLDRVVQDRELLLQELDAVVGYLLLHLQIEVRVAKSLVCGQLLAELIAEFFAHLLRDQ